MKFVLAAVLLAILAVAINGVAETACARLYVGNDCSGSKRKLGCVVPFGCVSAITGMCKSHQTITVL
jgi:hypothetical protein